MSTRTAPRSAAKLVLTATLGHRRLALMEARNKILLSRGGRALRRREDAEVTRLAATMSSLPRARVATVIATYRRPGQLRRAVESALAQTVRDQVVIVVDDGGGLPELPDDPRLVARSVSANIGVAGVVRNVGIRLTRSDYLAFLDDDNEWEPEHLAVALAALGPGQADLVYTALRRVGADGRAVDVLSTPFDRRLLARHGYVDTNAYVATRCEHLRFSRLPRPPQVRPREDWELIWRLSRRHRIVHVQEPTVRYLVNPDSYFTDWQADGILPPAT
jgi:hypothetical protein